MALTISCPIAAQLALRTLLTTYPPHSVESLVKVFLTDAKITEQKVRELAHTKRMPISAIVRGLMCAKYPQLKADWPLSKLTPAQVEGIAKRSRSPDGGELKRALELLSGMCTNPHDGRQRSNALKFLAKHGIVVEDFKLAAYNRYNEIDALKEQS